MEGLLPCADLEWTLVTEVITLFGHYAVRLWWKIERNRMDAVEFILLSVFSSIFSAVLPHILLHFFAILFL